MDGVPEGGAAATHDDSETQQGVSVPGGQSSPHAPALVPDVPGGQPSPRGEAQVPNADPDVSAATQLAFMAAQMAKMCGQISKLHEQLIANRRSTAALERHVYQCGELSHDADRFERFAANAYAANGDESRPQMAANAASWTNRGDAAQAAAIQASRAAAPAQVCGAPLQIPASQARAAATADHHGVNNAGSVPVPASRPSVGSQSATYATTLTHKPFDLPEFTGLPEQWPVFSATFHQSTAAFSYSALQNIFRLQKALKGEAREEVQFLLINPDNVDEIMRTLQFRFGRPEVLVRNQRLKMREIANISEQRLDLIIPFSSRVQNMVAFLNTDDNRHVLSESTLLAELVDKLPQSKRFEWATHCRNSPPHPTVIAFSAWLRELAHCVSLMGNQAPIAAQIPSGASQPRQSRPPSQPIPRPRHILNVQECRTQGNAACFACNGTHQLSKCGKFERMQVKDRWALARRGRMCFGCLKGGHRFDECRTKRNCPLDGCTYSHHEMLHEAEAPAPVNATREAGAQQASGTDRRGTTTAAAESHDAGGRSNPFAKRDEQPSGGFTGHVQADADPVVFYKVLPVTVYNGDRHIHTYALLDDGSALTMVDESLAAELDLSGPTTILRTKVIGNRTCAEPSQHINIEVSGASRERFPLTNVRTVRDITLPRQTLLISADDERHRHLQGLPIDEFINAKPRILIGLLQSGLGLTREYRESSCGGPIAARTKLGWVVYGSEKMPADRARDEACVLFTSEDDEQRSAADGYEQLNDAVQRFYTLENFGVAVSTRVMESDDDARARQILAATTKRDGERFVTGLLWRADEVRFPDSRDMARRRLMSIQRKMKRDPAYAALYQQQIDAFVQKGYARKLSTAEANRHDDRTWVLPHFGVQNVNKPGKLRLVFDAAAVVRGVSLNTELVKGPDLNQPLTSILFKFRVGRVGVCADIAEMFNQVLVRTEDRRAQRFLWAGVDGGPVETYEMVSMTFGATCSPTAAQFVKNMNADEHAHEFPDAAHAIKTMHYVDDFVASFESDEEAVRISRDVVEVHQRGGFQLRGFVSNSKEVLRALGASAEGEAISMQLDDASGGKILGMQWATKKDEFFFALRFDRVPEDVLLGNRPPTKRELLSAAMSVFDPFGYLANFLLPVKILVQDAFKEKIEWDEAIPAAMNERWRQWCDATEATRRCRIPRCYSPYLRSATSVQLHIFADASEEAFAAVAFWRIEHNGGYDLAFISGKSRCAPPKLQSIPRLELLAAVMAVRMYTNIKQCHGDIAIENVFLWTDSRTVLQWVQSTQRRFKPFVAHKVAEILDGTQPTWWRWLPTEANVADDGTRSKVQLPFDPEGRWIRGPAFLREHEDNWPAVNVASVPDGEMLQEELTARYVGIVTVGGVIEFERFSRFTKLRRTVAWVMRFYHNCTAKTRGQARRSGELLCTEVSRATTVLCRLAQQEGFAAEYKALETGQTVERSSSLVALMPFIDGDGVMRLYGRTDAAKNTYLSADAKRPVLLPHKHKLAELVVAHHHHEMAHQLEDAVICAVRRCYWVPNLRRLVRGVKSRCQSCRIRNAQPRSTVAGQLPLDRLTPHVFAFKFTGLDYFGPVSVTVGRRQEKRWIALFTCLTTRALHMEIAHDLSTDGCLLAIRNFCNVRGVPARIRSDCGTNFVGADNELRRMSDFIDTSAMQRATTTLGIEWVFNCPANPEAGGAWERLVQSAKRVLRVTLKEVAPHVETLRSMIIEAANIINARPLTHVPVSVNDLEPLTPNHFLLGRANAVTTAGADEPRQLCHRKHWRVQQQLMRQFWSRWVREYLPELTRRSKACPDVGPLKEGDLVLVCDANQSRGQWQRGRIESVVPGTDGRIRTATVRTAAGALRRPVSKLALLDVDGEASGTLTGPGMSPSGAERRA